MSKAITPSFSAKVSRAKKHLIDLEVEIGRYTSTKPYTVSKRIEGKRNVHRLIFTSDPANTDILIIAADVIYNLWSSLDHLMACLVAKKDRSSVMFPFYFQNVWEAIVPGENQQRIKERVRWASDIKTLSNDVVAILKSLQPSDDGRNVDEINLPQIIKTLSNRDRHEKLPTLTTGLRGMAIEWEMPDGTIQKALAPNTSVDAFFDNHTEIPVPDDAMNVKVDGAPVIAIRIAQEKGHIEIPNRLDMAARLIEEDIIPRLSPYIRSE
jgi:hypothetical protein